MNRMEHKSLVGVTVRDYRVERLLGRGGMGAVFLATHTRLDRQVALKVLPDELAKDETFIQRFEREARAIAQLQHPAIVQVHDMFEDQGDYFLILEYLGGGSIRDLLEDEGPLPEWAAACLIRYAALGLHAAAEAGFVHRDIKPDNLLLTQNGEVKVADFGLVHTEAAGTTLTEVGTTVGTPAYMAPEQWEDIRTCDHRTDLYSLGCTLYELLTGEPPFLGPSVTNFMTHHLTREAPSLRAKRPDVSPGMEQIVMCLLAKKQDDRYATGAELAAALEPFCQAPHEDSGVVRTARPESLADAATMPAQPAPPTPSQAANRVPVPPAQPTAQPAAAQQVVQPAPQPGLPGGIQPGLLLQAAQRGHQGQQTAPPVAVQPAPQPSVAPAPQPGMATAPQPGAQPAQINQNPVPTVHKKSKNKLIALAVFLGLILIAAFFPTTSIDRKPKYKEGQYLAEADKLVKAGKLGDAAWLYVGLANTSGPEGEKAYQKLKELIDDGARTPIAEVGEVFRAAREFVILQERMGKTQDKLFKKANEIVEQIQQKDPARAAAILSAVQPLAPKDLDVDNLIETLCQKALVAEPNNLDLLAHLADVYVRREKKAEVIELLAPKADRMGSSDTAALLGQVYGSQGNYGRALPLLTDYCDKRLDELTKTWDEFITSSQTLVDRMLEQLQRRRLRNFNYRAFERLDEHGQKAMLYERLAQEVFQHVHASILFFRTKKLSRRIGAFVLFMRARLNVALDKPKTERHKIASQVERQIKAMRTLIGHESFFLMHGMVCQLMGRRNMTRARFERLLLRREGEPLPVDIIIYAMLEVGAEKLCRSLLEEALAKCKTAEQRDVVLLALSDLSPKLEDKLKWLRESTTKKGRMSLYLELLRIDEALLEGDRDWARNRYRKLFKRAAETEDKKLKDYIVYRAAAGIYGLTGDKADLEIAAVASEKYFAGEMPSDKEAGRAAKLHVHKALQRHLGSLFRANLLLEPIDIHHLPYVYPSGKAMQAGMETIKKDKDFKRALAILKQTSASPSLLFSLAKVSRDEIEMQGVLGQQMTIQNMWPVITFNMHINQADQVRKEIDKTRNPREFAYATARFVNKALMVGDNSHVSSAGAAFSKNNAGAATVAVDALLANFLAKLEKKQPKLKAFIETCRELMPLRYAFALAASCDDEAAKNMNKDKNVRQALGIWKKYTKYYVDDLSAWEWALLKNKDPKRAAYLKEYFGKNTLADLTLKVEQRISSFDGGIAAEAYLRSLMAGDPLAGEKILARYRSQGVAIPKMSL